MQDPDPAGGVAQPCWCTLLPAVVAVPGAGAGAAAQACWCPACLRRHIAAQTTAAHVDAPAG